MKQFLRNHLFLLILAAVAGGDLLMWHLRVSPVFWVDYSYTVVLIALMVLEFVIPRNPSWNYITGDGIKYRELSADAGFMIAEAALVSAGIYHFANWSADHIRALSGLTNELSIHWTVQCLIAILVVDLVRYWIHRWMHQVPWLWRFHSMHHMPERLGAMSAARGNPIDDLIIYSPELIVLFALGFDRQVIFGLYSVIWVMTLIIHSNVEFTEAGLSRVFQQQKYHLIHHAYNDGQTPTYNFAEILTLWDRLFGTFRNDPVGLDHRTGVVRDQPRGWVREFFGWTYLPIGRL